MMDGDWYLLVDTTAICNKAEQNYSPVEGEATAVARGLEDTKFYTLGCKDLYVATDHSPLVKILGDKSLADEENPRLAKIKTRTLWWNFKIIHVPGKLQEASDAISRRNTSKVNVVWQPERQPDHSSADLLSDQEEPNPWLPAALYTIEVKQSAKEAGDLNEDMQTVLRYVNSVIGLSPNVTSWNRCVRWCWFDGTACVWRC